MVGFEPQISDEESSHSANFITTVVLQQLCIYCYLAIIIIALVVSLKLLFGIL